MRDARGLDSQRKSTPTSQLPPLSCTWPRPVAEIAAQRAFCRDLVVISATRSERLRSGELSRCGHPTCFRLPHAPRWRMGRAERRPDRVDRVGATTSHLRRGRPASGPAMATGHQPRGPSGALPRNGLRNSGHADEDRCRGSTSENGRRTRAATLNQRPPATEGHQHPDATPPPNARPDQRPRRPWPCSGNGHGSGSSRASR